SSKLLTSSYAECPMVISGVYYVEHNMTSLFHMELWHEFLGAAKCMPIVGDIASSHRWAPDRKPHWTLSELMNSVLVWESTMKDVQEGAAIRPFFDNDVSKLVGDGDDDHGIPTLRFEVVQKSKVRGVDSATSNGINMATVRTQKLELPSTAANVAVIKRAYRQIQIPISPSHRKRHVVSLKDPPTGNVAFFVMVDHSFGLASAVYNYNRRSAAITDILRRVFTVANFYDDEYDFEPSGTDELLSSRSIGGGYELDARRAAKPTADPVPPRLLVPDNAAVEVKHTVTSSALRPKPKSKLAADPQPSSVPSGKRADPAPLGAPRPKPKAFATLRRDAVLEEPIEVAPDSPPDPIEDF
ncbi:unnamed protein product, partial [Symbiodinium microadriaticum]